MPKNKIIRQIRALLPEALAADRFAAEYELTRIEGRIDPKNGELNHQRRLVAIRKRIERSIQKKCRRKERLPSPVYNEALPIFSRRDDIVKAIRENPVVIISGETGSGKTTQIPKFCLEAGRGLDGSIGCTQPRRIAAVSVAQRIAEEFGQTVGESVGYKIRFNEKLGPDTCIKIMTDGILLAETQSDRLLTAYDTLIIDEAHERSLNIDFVIGILRTLLDKRTDLKVIITSATIDTEKFSTAFGNAPIIEVSGRMYPVEVLYWADADSDAEDEPNYVDAAVSAVRHIHQRYRSGDILVFMPTEQDIRETIELLEAKSLKGAVLLPLFARLAGAEQTKVFKADARRKIIVSTNVAETSITIPGIKYVVDTGLARISQYLPKSRTTCLPVTPVSKSSADQRMGRCGRVQNGVCYRLYTQADYESRPLFTPPEILRSNLAEVILQMTALGLGAVHMFPFIDKPTPRLIQDGYDLLFELGAIEKRSIRKRHGRRSANPNNGPYSLTEKGRLMARIPLDPRLSRMLIEADKRGCTKEMAVIASALSIQDPKERPIENADEADAKHNLFASPVSDFIGLLRIWENYRRIFRKKASTSRKYKEARQFCRDHYISFRRLREWQDIHNQILSILEEAKFDVRNGLDILDRKVPVEADALSHPGYEQLHKSILAGFLSNIALKKEKNVYQAAKGKETMIFPGSGLFNKGPRWIAAAEFVETSRRFARTVAGIDPQWAIEVGENLCRHAYLNPRFDADRGEVVADEQVSLFGLILSSGKPVSFGRKSRSEASDIFIREALVEARVLEKPPFLQHNLKVISEVADMENRLRRRDILVGEKDLFDFYRSRLPDIIDIKSLKSHVRKNGGDGFLRMTRTDVMIWEPRDEFLELFPDSTSHSGQKLAYAYDFSPGNNTDGVTLKVPCEAVGAVAGDALDWVVPGLLREKVEALVKGLPKGYRKQLVPVSGTVDKIVRALPKCSDKSLFSVLSDLIHKQLGVEIPAHLWARVALPEHLKMRIAVTDTRGNELAAGRDKTVLYQSVAGAKSTAGRIPDLASINAKLAGETYDRWTFGDLDQTFELTAKDKRPYTVYPALTITAASQPGPRKTVLSMFSDRQKALAAHTRGVAALYENRFSKELRYLKRCLVLPSDCRSMSDPFGGAKKIESDMYARVTEDLFAKNIRGEAAFVSHAEQVEPLIMARGKELAHAVCELIRAGFTARMTIFDFEKANAGMPKILDFLSELRRTLSLLIPENFVHLYALERFSDITRYVGALSIRAERGIIDPEKDRRKAEKLQLYTSELDRLARELTPASSKEKKDAVEALFWLIEEYKVSLFAQELKTAVPVSEKRLKEKIREIGRLA